LDRVFLRQQLKFQGINLDNGSGKPSKGTLQEILANPDLKRFRHSLCNQSHSKARKAKEKEPFPKTKRAYLFIVKQIKHSQSSFIKPWTSSARTPFQAVWVVLYHHNTTEQLEKRFLGTG
jgi:hypothetical protein